MAAASAVQEFQDHYKPISDAQRVYEARAEGLLSQLKQNPGAKLEVDTLGNAPWERIRKLPRLGTLLDKLLIRGVDRTGHAGRPPRIASSRTASLPTWEMSGCVLTTSGVFFHVSIWKRAISTKVRSAMAGSGNVWPTRPRPRLRTGPDAGVAASIVYQPSSC